MAFTKFDNLNDVNTKFLGTICYYDNRAVYIKNIVEDEHNPGKNFILSAQIPVGKYQNFSILDPKFNYIDYNLGYANMGKSAFWWYRKPIRQYRQGLKKDQMGVVGPDGIFDLDMNFQYHDYFIRMLENKYPSIEKCADVLKQGVVSSIAFNRDFALSWDELHEAFTLQYHATPIGVITDAKLKSFRFIKEYKYLEESLKEAVR